MEFLRNLGFALVGLIISLLIIVMTPIWLPIILIKEVYVALSELGRLFVKW